MTIPLYYQGHAYRAGSRIRVTIAAPNGDQPIWSFGETDPSGTATVSIARSKQMPSRLLLPVVPGVSVSDRAAAVPGPAGRAVPRLPALPESRGDALGPAAGRCGRAATWVRRAPLSLTRSRLSGTRFLDGVARIRPIRIHRPALPLRDVWPTARIACAR